MELWHFMHEVYESVDERAQELEPLDVDEFPSPESLKLEVGKWYRLHDVVCVYVDLKDSSKASFRKTKTGMAKIYEHVGTGLTKIFRNDNFKGEYVDLKGDGGFVLYTGKYSEVRAFIAAQTFKTYVYHHLRNVFDNIEIRFGIGISKGSLLVKRVGTRKWNYPVWAGRVVNHAALICKDVKQKFQLKTDVIGASQAVYAALDTGELRDYLVISCGCPHGRKEHLWREATPDDSAFPKYYYIEANWCETHGEEYINAVIGLINE